MNDATRCLSDFPEKKPTAEFGNPCTSLAREELNSPSAAMPSKILQSLSILLVLFVILRIPFGTAVKSNVTPSKSKAAAKLSALSPSLACCHPNMSRMALKAKDRTLHPGSRSTVAVPDILVEHWTRHAGDQIISQIELWTLLAIRWHYRSRFSNRRIISYRQRGGKNLCHPRPPALQGPCDQWHDCFRTSKSSSLCFRG